MAQKKAEFKKEKKTALSIFGITPKTKKQKKFVRIFIVLKSIIYLIIFVLVIIFLWRLSSLG